MDYVGKMQMRAEVMSYRSDNDHTELEQLDKRAKLARDILIDSMKGQLGEPGPGVKRRVWRPSSVGPEASQGGRHGPSDTREPGGPGASP